MNIQLMVCTYDSRVDMSCTQSILSNIFNVKGQGHKIGFQCETGNCYIQDARNKCCDHFVKSTADVMLFIDSDLSFDSGAVLKIMDAHKKVPCTSLVAGVYPFKNCAPGLQEWPVCFNGEQNKIYPNGLMRAKWAPTGFMLITQSTLKLFREKYPDMQNSAGMFLYFDCGVYWPDKVWHGEDVYFCRRMTEAGAEIWVQPDITFEHIGNGCKSGGNFLQVVKNSHVGEKNYKGAA